MNDHYLAIEVQIYPTKLQKKQLNQAFGCSRYLYNHYLQKKNEVYRETGKNFNYYDCCSDLVQLKKTLTWLRETNSQSLQATLRQLEGAFLNFFRGKTKFPKFKKRSNHQSFHIPQHFSVDQENQTLKIPKMESLKFRGGNFSNVKEYCSIAISKTPSGKYFASILSVKEIPAGGYSTNTIGIDLGLKDFAVCSNGTKISKPKKSKTKHLKYLQKKHAKKTKGSKQREKLRIKIARIYERSTNKLKDFHHKLSKKIVDENQVVAVETLSVKNMMKNHCLARAIQESGWSQFLQFLEYKAKIYGRNFVKIDRWYPSSKSCSECGGINESLKLSQREWTCAECATVHDRDVNAARNILRQGINELSGTGTVSDIKQKQVEALTSDNTSGIVGYVESMTLEALTSLDVV